MCTPIQEIQPCTNHQTIQKRTKVFVSKHNNTLNLSPHQIASYIAYQCPHLSLPPASDDFRITNSHVVLKECLFCSKPTNGKSDNQYKLYIHNGSGAYFCHRCGAKGSWYDFKSSVGGFSVDSSSNVTNSELNQAWNWSTSNNNGMSYVGSKQLGSGTKQKVECLPMPPKKMVSLQSTRMFDSEQDKSSKEYAALKYLTEVRGLSQSVLMKYGVGCATYNFPSKEAGASYVSSTCVTFPWLMRESEVAEQEELRGAEYFWKSVGDGDNDNTEGERDSRRASKKKTEKKKKMKEMTALERHLARQQRLSDARAKKEADAATQDDPNTLSKAMVDALLKGKSIEEETPDEQKPLTSYDITSQYGPYIPRRIKVRSIEKKSWQRLDPPGGGFGLFGWHTIPHDATEIIITEGEFDAMAVNQATGRPAVSLPNGCRSLPMEVLVLLEKFDTVYLWLDNDGEVQS
jgi:hypothetical protein